MSLGTNAAAGSRPGRRFTIRRILGWLQIGLTLAVFVFWFFELRPQGLGGPASYALVSGKSMLPLYHTGDVVVVHSHPAYHVGQVIAYRVPKGEVGAGDQVIHRIIGGNGTKGFVVQGDNRTAPDIWHPKTADVVGSAWVHIPKAGFVVKLLHTPLVLAAFAAAVVVIPILTRRSPKPHEGREQMSETLGKTEEKRATAEPDGASAEPMPEPGPEPEPEPRREPEPARIVPAAQSLLAREFDTAFRGYSRDQVRRTLSETAWELESLTAELDRIHRERDLLADRFEQAASERDELHSRLELALSDHRAAVERIQDLERERREAVTHAPDDLGRQRELESRLTEAFVSAERTATELRFRAQREAEALIAEAKQRARAITSNAELERSRALGDVRAIRGVLKAALGAIGDAHNLTEIERQFERDVRGSLGDSAWPELDPDLDDSAPRSTPTDG